MNKRISFIVVLFLLFSTILLINMPISVYATEANEDDEILDEIKEDLLENADYEDFEKELSEEDKKLLEWLMQKDSSENSTDEKDSAENGKDNSNGAGSSDSSTDWIKEYGLTLPKGEELFTQSTIENMLNSGKAEVIKPDFVYDKQVGHFIYKSGNNKILESNIPNDGMSSKAVYLRLDKENVLVSLIDYDGEIVKLDNSGYVDKPGNYTVYIACNQEKTDGDGSAFALYCFSFRILPKYVNNLGVITVPEQFYIDSVTLNDEPIEIDGYFTQFLDKDGEYVIRYCYEKDENMVIKLKFTRDTVAPEVTFDNGPVNGFTKGIVKYYPTEKKEKITVYYEGQEVIPENNELYISGRYRIEASDEAGNVREYKFVNKAEYHFFSKEIIIIGVLILICLFAFMIFNRRNNYGV